MWPILRVEQGFRLDAGTLFAQTMRMQLSTKRAVDSSADSPLIPDRLYFKIGDVARICEVETYVLRFWETQFPQLRPNKSGTGQRLYRRRDVELALRIKRLVHAEGYTISGARQALDGHRRVEPQAILPMMVTEQSQPQDSVAETIAHARNELREIASLLASPVLRPSRRRARLATIAACSDSLFPS